MKKTLTIILIISLLFSLGCVKKDTDGRKPSEKAFAFTGKNGITVDFDPDAPPITNFKDEPIEIILKVKNRGAVSLAAREIQSRLKGVVATEIFQPTTTETSNNEELLAAELDPTTTEIDMGTITYSPEIMLTQIYEPKIKIEVCFPYSTKINANNFWISNKQDDLDKGKILSSDNSDAPVHATNLEEFKGTGKIRFQFTVSNVGEGTIVDECFPEEKSGETVEISILEPRGVNCETLGGGNSGEVTLINGKKIVRCSVEIPKDESYATPLVMTLDYHYDLELSKKITIQNPEVYTEP